MINIYSSDDISKIRASGKITAQAMTAVISEAKVGVTTSFLDKLAEKVIRAAGGEPSFMKEKGYFWTTCMNVNDIVVHGIPGEYQLKNGDVLGIDLGTLYQGFHSDASWTVRVMSNDKLSIINKTGDRGIQKFLETGEKALKLAIKQVIPGNYIGDISKVIEDTLRSGGYSPVKALVGHGVGKKLHEDPEVPCYLRGEIKNTPEIKEGMVLAIEVIYNQGASEVVYASDDGWTIVTRDYSLSGLFEHTVAVTNDVPTVLTIP